MRKFIIKGLAGMTVFGAIIASASTLGGLSNTTGVGAESTNVTSCDTDGVQTAETSTWSDDNNQYEVGSVTVSGISDDCDGQLVSVTITRADGTKMGDGSATVDTAVGPDDSSKVLTIMPGAKTEDINMIHVNISAA